MSCSGEDGTCDKPVEKGGLCAAHRYRLTHAMKKPLAAPVRPYGLAPSDGLFRAQLDLRDELDTATDEEFQRPRERARWFMRLKLYEMMVRSLLRWPWAPEQRAEVLRFLEVKGKPFRLGKKHPLKKHLQKKHLTHHQLRRTT